MTTNPLVGVLQTMALETLEPQCNYISRYNIDFSAGGKKSDKLNEQNLLIKASMMTWVSSRAVCFAWASCGVPNCASDVPFVPLMHCAV